MPELPEVVIVTATLRVSELSVSEGDTATLNIELSEPTSEDVTLTLTVVAGGSADVMVDYEPLLGTGGDPCWLVGADGIDSYDRG